jgi:hypothetical protein
MHRSLQLIASAAALYAGASANAQIAIDWQSIDGGGSTTPSTGGTFTLVSSIGQPDAGTLAGGSVSVLGGFWAVAAAGGTCYANCDNSTSPPILNVNDFICFQQRFAAGAAYANCDGSTSPPVLNVNDFICFQQRFAAGCP